MDMQQWLLDYTTKIIRQQAERLEQEARVLMRMGFTDLRIVQYPDGHKEVHPRDENDQ